MRRPTQGYLPKSTASADFRIWIKGEGYENRQDVKCSISTFLWGLDMKMPEEGGDSFFISHILKLSYT